MTLQGSTYPSHTPNWFSWNQTSRNRILSVSLSNTCQRIMLRRLMLKREQIMHQVFPDTIISSLAKHSVKLFTFIVVKVFHLPYWFWWLDVSFCSKLKPKKSKLIWLFWFSGKMTLLEAIAERESIYRLLPQTTPENTSKDYSSYTAEPQSRYPTLNTKLVLPCQVLHLVDTDNPSQVRHPWERLP